MELSRARAIVRLLPAMGLLCAQGAAAAEAEGNHVDVSVAERLSYDDNLFRLPADAVAVNLPVDGEFRREDYLNRASLGLDGSWYLGSQAINLDLIVSDNRFSRNDDLDYVSGTGRLIWDWRTAGDWSGHAGVNYDRLLASFANRQVYIRDLLETIGYFGDVRYGIGSRWAIRAGAARLETTHDAPEREADDYQGDIGTVALEYVTPASTLLGLDYRHAVASFPRAVVAAGTGLAWDYTDDTAGIHVRKALTGKTTFDGTAGYLRRNYENPAVDDFSGDVWRLSLVMQPGIQTQVLLSGWRELRAYADVESDYFKATGASVAPTWSPTEKLKLQLAVSWERQEYLGSNLALPASLARRDTVEGAQFQAIYLPRMPLEFTFTYRFEQRDSNRPTYTFDDNLASLGVKFVF